MTEMYKKNRREGSYDEVFRNYYDGIDKIPFWMTVLDDIYYQICRKNFGWDSSKNKKG